MLMMKKASLFLLNLLSICFLTACSSNSSAPVQTSLTTRDDLYANTGLWPSSHKAHLLLATTLVERIRAAGGEVYQAGSFVTIVLPADALFEPATANLLPGSEKLVVDMAKIIVRFPEENVIITAHTDGLGSALFQAKLTRQQAQLVAIALWQQNEINLKTFQRFKYAGMGGMQPITNDPSSYGASLNRRLQVTIYPTQKMRETYKSLGNPDLYQQ